MLANILSHNATRPPVENISQKESSIVIVKYQKCIPAYAPKLVSNFATVLLLAG